MTFIDPRIKDIIVIREAPSLPAWKCTRIDFQDEGQAQGQHHIWVFTIDNYGQPKDNVLITHFWPTMDQWDDSVMQKTILTQDVPPGYPRTNTALTNFGIYAMTPPEGPGPYGVKCQGLTDTVWGMGLPGKRHVNFILTYQWTTEGPKPPDPDPVKFLDGEVSIRVQDKTGIRTIYGKISF